ncbi:PAAR domain-containing protein [Achromobacter xylosoxidans]|uniref:PAAR domain-containing protein n=1 Tax=Alcaligenes xylosoxydans xylosoxydans TaxID=85698 RepID=UPI0022B8DBAB|nr:PAAR domain-containing protein [Achromobacter xylosoxidans]MCZ8393002.1 PAAR domain-containing protein [Achromobacter xylosoxidans]
MTGRAIIRRGDRTSHGGIVVEGHPTSMLLGQEIALVGHKVMCPKCKGVFPILPDPGRNHSFMGNDTAVEGMRTACGAVLIASQMVARISEAEGLSDPTNAPTPQSETLCQECLESAARTAATTVARG